MRVGARRIAVSSIVLSPLLAVAPLSAPRVSAVSCSSSGPAYDVRSGDGWYAIAERAEIDVGSLLEVNDASVEDALHPGDRLCLPGGANLVAICPATATVGSGDGWLRIAERAGASLASVLSANGADVDSTLHPGEVVCLPPGSGQEIRMPAGVAAPGTPHRSGGVATLAAAPTQGPCWFSDSWGDGRPGGRRHVGADVFTLRRAYVYAVADGTLTMRKWAQPGNISGNAWRLTADDGTAYFYAHLFDFAPDLRVGSRVAAGQIIGWVGATGNTDVEHLHFEIRPGGGSPVDPHPTLRSQGACNHGTPYTQPGGWVPD